MRSLGDKAWGHEREERPREMDQYIQRPQAGKRQVEEIKEGPSD
jgi:hypothetical protein